MDIKNISAIDLIESVRSGTLAVSDIAQQTSAAIEEKKDINAVISSNTNLVSENAKRLDEKIASGDLLPLHGLPVLIKDNINTVDFPTTAGTPALANNQPADDAGVVSLLKNAGALICGKANMHELAFGITSNNACTGAVHNPYNKDLIPGGSSGGSAAAVAAGIVPVSLGSDTGGSNRIPASLCGVCGFRPGSNRYPGDGFINLSKTRDTAGVFARNMSDLALVDEILSNGDEAKPVNIENMRLAVPRDPFFKALENETTTVIESALELIEKSGATLVEVDMQELFSLNDKISFPIAVYETLRDLADYLKDNNVGVNLEQMTAMIKSPDVKHIMQVSMTDGNVPEEVYLEALNVHRPQIQKMYADYFLQNEIDAIVYPTTPLTARPIGDDETVDFNGHRLPTFPSYVRNGDPASNAGIPSLSIPAGLTPTGLPVGLSIDGPADSDAKVLGIGLALEAILPRIDGPTG
jgi:indoleacetamide hydrolase